MNKRKIYVFIALVLALLIIAGLTAILTKHSSGDEPDPQETSEVTQQPSDPTDTPDVTDAPEVTATPEPTAAPEPTPTPTPTPTPVPDRDVSASGSFASDTGTNLNLAVSWNAVAKNADELSVTFNIYLKSYTIGVGSRVGSISINGQNYSFSTDGVDIENNSTISTTLIASETVTVPGAAGETVSFPVAVSWIYNGSYNGKSLDTITAQDTIVIKG